MMGLLDPRLMAYLQQRGIQAPMQNPMPPQMQRPMPPQMPRPMPPQMPRPAQPNPMMGQMPNPLMPRPMPQQNYFGQQMFPAQVVRSDVPLAAARPGAVTRPYLPGMNPIMRGPVGR